MYRNSIGVPKDYRYGIEIEFADVNLFHIYSKLLKQCLPVLYREDHKLYDLDFSDWYLDIDPTVTVTKNHVAYGGELSSKILKDTPEDWKEIKKICETLRENGATINPFCGFHMTVDGKPFMNPKFLETLYKLLIVYEIDMSLFYMGDHYFMRKTKDEFAKNMSLRLLKNISQVDFHNIDSVFFKSDCFTSRDGINFSKWKDRGLIEFRYPNGCMDEEVIQNMLNFTLKLISAISQDKIDLDYLNYMVSVLKDDPFFVIECQNYIDNPSSFFSLIDVISTSETDQDDFKKQYQKVIQTRP